MKPRFALAAACATVAALTACGSTVQQSTATLPSSASDGFSLGRSATATEPGGVSGRPAGNGSAAGVAAPGGMAPAPGGAPAVATPAGAVAPRSGQGAAPVGITATTITVGVSYAANAGAANGAIGGRGITTGDEPADANAVIAAINRDGGVLGRKLVPQFYQRDAQSTAPVANQAQAECSFYTQDHHVFVVLLQNGPVDWAAKHCLTKAGVPAITSHIVSLDDGDPSLPLDVDVAGMNEADLARAQLASITDQDWLSGWNSSTGGPGPAPVKVGVVSYDLPSVNRAVAQVLLPGLRAAGHPVSAGDVYRVAIPQATSDDASAEAALQNAALRLHSDGVTHVVLVDNGGAMTLLFANDIYSQHYFPRLAGTSSNGFQALLTGGDIQPAVLRGVVGAGWEPVIDLPLSDTGPDVTAARRSCLGVLHGAGQTFTDANSEAVALGYCDKLFFLRSVLTKAGSPTTGAYLDAVNGLGTFSTARGYSSTFTTARHDGGTVYRDLVFDSGCGCLAYAGTRHDV